MQQMLTFLVVGAANTGFGFGVIFGCMHILNWPPEASNLAGYILGFALSFSLHRNATFRSTGVITAELKRYCLGVCAAYLVNLSTLLLLVRVLEFDANYGQFWAVTAYVATFYLITKFYVFAKA